MNAKVELINGEEVIAIGVLDTFGANFIICEDGRVLSFTRIKKIYIGENERNLIISASYENWRKEIKPWRKDFYPS